MTNATIEAENLNDVAAALCVVNMHWRETKEAGAMLRGADEALSMVYARAQEMDPAAFEAYRTLTALFYVLKALTRGHSRADIACARFARRFA